MNNKMKKIFIVYNNIIIKLLSNDTKMIENIMYEFNNYYKFIEIDNESNFNNEIILLNDAEIYNKYDQNIKYKENDQIIAIRKHKILVSYDKKQQKIYVIYEKNKDIVLQYIGEIILSIFGKNIENNGFYFLHSACASYNNNAVVIIGERASGKTTILCRLMQRKFDFIANSQIGIGREAGHMIAIGLPSRIGIRRETIDKYLSNIEKNKIIEIKNRDYINNLSKINLSVAEINQIFNIKTRDKANLKMIIIPIYNQNIKHIQVREISDSEIIEELLKNRRLGVYEPQKDIDKFYKTNRVRCELTFFKDINFFKITQNENTIDELTEWMENYLSNG